MATKKEKLLKEAQERGLEMDENNTIEELEIALNDLDAQEDQSGTKYFKTNIAALKVKLDDPNYDDGEVHIKTLRFKPFAERDDDGYRVKVGYLKTADKRALKVLEKDTNVTEISEELFYERTDPTNKGVKPLPY